MDARATVRWTAAVLAAASGLLSTACTCTDVTTTHYVGVFDPQEQVTQELYRITIHGHAKPMSNVKYASGWVPAAAADLLTKSIRFDGNDVALEGTDSATVAALRPERRFFELGPLGVALEPYDARFVVVMNSDPDYFFQQISLLTNAEKNPRSGAALEAKRRKLQKDIADERAKALDELGKTQKKERE